MFVAGGGGCTVAGATTGIWPWIGTKPGGIAANGTKSIGFALAVDELERKLVARWLIADDGLMGAIVVIGPVDVVCCCADIWFGFSGSADGFDGIVAVQRHELVDVSVLWAVTNRRLTWGCALFDGSARTVADRIDDAAEVTVYGVACTRWIWPIVGFGIFGDQTAHGKSPTKRSPTDGLASGCVCEVIFTWLKDRWRKFP